MLLNDIYESHLFKHWNLILCDIIFFFSTQVTDVTKGTGSAYVIKIEPHDNGPLFSELSFYQRKAKPEHGMYVCHKLHKVSFALLEITL